MINNTNNNNKNKVYETFNNKVELEYNERNNVPKLQLDNCLVKYIYTIIQVIAHLTNAMVTSMFSPTMVDMKYMFRTSITKIAYVNTFLGIGFLAGTLFGFGLKYMDRHFAFIIFTLIQTIFYALMPLVSELWMLYLCAFVVRAGMAAFECGSYVWLISLWRQHYYAINHFIHFSFSFGIFLGPILDSPFVLGDVTKNIPNQSELNETLRDEINYAIDRRSNLIVPFLIATAISSIMPIGLLVMLFVNKYEPQQEMLINDENQLVKSKFSSTESQILDSSYTYILIGLIAVSLCSQNGLVISHVAYLPTYFQCLPNGISAQKAAQILSVFSGCHAFGRLVSIFESMKVSAAHMIIIHTSIAYLGQILLFFGKFNEIFIWIGNVLLGLGYSSMWTSYFNLTEEYLKLTETLSSLFLFLSQLLVVIMPFLIGPVIEKNPIFFLYVEFCLQTLDIILFILILLLIKRYRN